MNLVDYIHAVFLPWRGEIDLVPYLPDVVHAVVGGGVYFLHVENRSVVDTPAYFTFVAGLAVLRMKAVDRLCEKFWHRWFCRFLSSR